MTYRQKVAHRIARHLRSLHEQIKPVATAGMFNFRCYENAVEYARLHPDMDVVEVIYLDEGQPILHFVNRDKEGTYLETTLGYRALYLEYYFIRKIDPPDYRYIASEFERDLDVWLVRFTNWFERNILRVQRVL